MTATTSTIPTRKPTVFSTVRPKGARYNIDATADTALADLTTSSTIRNALDILGDVVERARAVDKDTIGSASHVLTASGIGTLGDFQTQSNFANNLSAGAATITPGPATVTINTNGTGQLTGVNITGAGVNYEVGEKVQITAGAGRATATVLTVV